MKKVSRILRSKAGQALTAQAAMAGAGLLVFMLLARHLSKESFGGWVFFLTALMFMEMLKAGFVQTALVKYASGTGEEEHKRLMGASWKINLFMSTVFSLVLLVVYLFAPEHWAPGVKIFLWGYPIYNWLVLPLNYAVWKAQSREQFALIAHLRVLGGVLYVVATIVLVWLGIKDLGVFVWMYIGVQFFQSLYALSRKWTDLSVIRKGSKQELKKLWRFGRYHVFSYLGTNLLKSADIFVIGLYFTSADLAVYGVALKLVEIIEIPLRGVISLALPRMSAAHNQGQLHEVKKVLKQFAGSVSLLFVPVLLGLFLWAEEVIFLFAGEGYESGVWVLRLFLVYGGLITVDRFLGVALDALDLPQHNFKKVMAMAASNVVGNIVAALLIGELWALAAVTVLNVLVGLFVGRRFVARIFPLSLAEIYLQGWSTLALKSRMLWRKS